MDAVVEVAGGQVRGIERDGVWAFSGIPYARSPAGSLRWRPPQSPDPWSGVRDATEFGPIAPQSPPVPGLSIPGDPAVQSEDCLSLNVWTPALDGGRRPVMVWIHGGGFTTGTGAGLLYRGGPLAREGDVVVVTMNYRLGALGFLGHPALSEGPEIGNWGLLDQVAALRWVRQNIASFGGDPTSVTVFGESSGGMSIAALLAAPAARGLFHRAIIQSGPPYTHTVDRAVQASDDLAKLLGVSEVTRQTFESIPAADLVVATQSLQNRLPGPGELPLPFLPVIDGTFLTRPPLEAVAAGKAAALPLLIGTTRDELSFYAIGDPRLANIDEDGLVKWMLKVSPGGSAEGLIDTYRRVRSDRGESTAPRDLWVAMGSDLVFRWPSLRLAAAQAAHQRATYTYLFTWESPAFDGLLGSCHALEIPFIFGGITRPAIALYSGDGPEAVALSTRMQQAWIAFARSGDPSVAGNQWPSWETHRRSTMVFGPSGGAIDAPRNQELAIWETMAPLSGSHATGGNGASRLPLVGTHGEGT